MKKDKYGVCPIHINHLVKFSFEIRWVPACAVVTQTDIALYLRGKEGNRTSYAEERTEDLEKYGILVVGQDQDRPGIILGFAFCELSFSK